MEERQKKNILPEIKSPWVRWGLFTLGALGMGLVTALLVLWLNYEVLSVLCAWLAESLGALALTALLYGVAIYVVSAAVGRLWLGGAIVGISGVILALVNYFQTAINGTPLSLVDFGLITQLGDVAGVAGSLVPPRDFWLAVTALLVCAGVLFLFRKWTAIRGKFRGFSVAGSLALLVFMFTTTGGVVFGGLFGVDVNSRMPIANNNAAYGLTLALWRDVVIDADIRPEGYSEAYMQNVLTRIDEILAEDEPASATAGVEPNVLFILSESFYDLTKLPDLTYERDPLENFHRLEKESISGDFFTHYVGYGTGYLEMAMQYGITNRDFALGTNICFMEDETYERFDSLAEQFTKTGHYQAEMLHAYNDSLYNRTVTYPMLGYANSYYSADVQQLGIPWEGSVYGGYYLRDDYFFDGMLNRMEVINAEGKRAFLYGITMENHQPFDPEKFGYVCQIGVESETFGPGNMEIVRVMLEGITRADQALGRLTDALQASEEPTVVVFFGDHRPNLFMTDGDTVYTHLGLCPENDTLHWTAEQIGDLYSTDYLIWANDAAREAGITATEQDSSITALGPQVLEVLHQPVSRYWGLLQKVSEVCLNNIDLYFVDGESTPYHSVKDASLTEEAKELLALREAVIYDACSGEQYITAAMNAPAGT